MGGGAVRAYWVAALGWSRRCFAARLAAPGVASHTLRTACFFPGVLGARFFCAALDLGGMVDARASASDAAIYLAPVGRISAVDFARFTQSNLACFTIRPLHTLLHTYMYTRIYRGIL